MLLSNIARYNIKLLILPIKTINMRSMINISIPVYLNLQAKQLLLNHLELQ